MRTPAVLALAVLLALLAAALPSCGASPEPQPLPALRAEQWAADVDFLLRELPKRHANAFHHTPRPAFEAAGAQLRQRAATGDADAMVVGLMQLLAGVGDGHTRLHLPAGVHRLPLALAPFGDDLRVTRATEAARALIGGKLVRIDDVPAAEAVARVRTVIAQAESEAFLRGSTPSMLPIAEVLHGLGIVADPRRVRVTVALDTGGEQTLELATVPAQPVPRWIAPAGALPLYRQRPDEPFASTWLAEAATVYVAFRGYDGLGANARALWKLVDARRPKKVVFDLRGNGGGDYTEGRKHLVSQLARRPWLRAYAIVGNRTFSAAMNNAVDLRNAGAMLVGEPIGERPNSYQENDELVLPQSRLVVSYSTRYYSFVPAEGPQLVVPDHPVEPTWQEFAAGRDPALEWILAQP
jgi:hypothetical protein